MKQRAIDLLWSQAQHAINEGRYIESEHFQRFAMFAQELSDALWEIKLIGFTIFVTFGIIGVIILLNQRKIRKELRQLREMMEKEELND